MRYLTFFLMIVFIGCKSVSFSNATKKLHKKGIESGKDYIDYSIVVESKTDFFVDNISIENSSESIEYFYKSLSSGESSYKMLTPFLKGKYEFKFRIYAIERISKEEVLLFNYTTNGEKKVQKIPILKNKEIGINK